MASEDLSRVMQMIKDARHHSIKGNEEDDDKQIIHWIIYHGILEKYLFCDVFVEPLLSGNDYDLAEVLWNWVTRCGWNWNVSQRITHKYGAKKIPPSVRKFADNDLITILEQRAKAEETFESRLPKIGAGVGYTYQGICYILLCTIQSDFTKLIYRTDDRYGLVYRVSNIEVKEKKPASEATILTNKLNSIRSAYGNILHRYFQMKGFETRSFQSALANNTYAKLPGNIMNVLDREELLSLDIDKLLRRQQRIQTYLKALQARKDKLKAAIPEGGYLTMYKEVVEDMSRNAASLIVSRSSTDKTMGELLLNGVSPERITKVLHSYWKDRLPNIL